MKRIFAFLLCVACLALVGCNSKPSETTTGVIGTEQTPSGGSESTSGTQAGGSTPAESTTSGTTQLPNPSVASYTFRKGYPSTNLITDTPTRILYFNSDQLYYYNKLDGENYVFCFDPLCRHQWGICLSYRFMLGEATLQNIEYCAYNNRFYALRGQKFCSFSFDGSDLKIEYSFGESGGWDEIMYAGDFDLRFLKVYDRYAYMISVHPDTGKRRLMRYNVATSRMENLTENMDLDVVDYLFAENTIYLDAVYQGESGMYRADLELKTIEAVMEGSYTGVFDGKRMYFLEYSYEFNGESMVRTPIGISVYDPNIGAVTQIYKLLEGEVMPRLLAVTDDAIYYTKREPVSVGHRVTQYGIYDVNNSYSKIYRMDKDGRNVKVILDDIHYETTEIYISDSVILIQGRYCTPDEKNAEANAAAFVGHFDANGMIVDIEIIG